MTNEARRMSDLTERLQAAAAAAIADERPTLAHDPARLRGITVELTIANNGAVIEGRCWVERATRPIRGDRPTPTAAGTG